MQRLSDGVKSPEEAHADERSTLIPNSTHWPRCPPSWLMWHLRRVCTHSTVVTTRLTRHRNLAKQPIQARLDQAPSLMHSEHSDAEPGTASSCSSLPGEGEVVATSADDRINSARGGRDGSTRGGQGGDGARSASGARSAKQLDDSIFTMRAIGVVRSPFKQKFGIPRQPGLAPAAVATIELRPPFNNVDAVRGLEGWSHVWITFVFHGISEQQVCVALHRDVRATRRHAALVVVLCFHVLDVKLCSCFSP